MVKFHAATGLVVRNVITKILAGGKRTQSKYCDVNIPNHALNDLRGAGVKTFFNLPKWVQISLAIKRNNKQSVWRDHRRRFADRSPHITSVMKHAPRIDDIKNTFALGLEVKDAHGLDTPGRFNPFGR